VVGRVYDYEGEVDALLDEVERDVLRISESRVQAHTDTMKDLGLHFPTLDATQRKELAAAKATLRREDH